MSTFDQDSRPPVLEAGRVDHQCWIDLWCYGELIFIRAWRDVAERNEQTLIGTVGSCGRPFKGMMEVFTMPPASRAGLLKQTGLPAAGQEPVPG